MTQTAAASHVLELHEIKGVLTKFMRMLFPLEFRLDGITGEGAVSAAFRYPLLAGEVIYLPERSDNFTSRDEAFSYYKVIAAHLAARHEFGSFAFKLGDQPGFEERGETGLEALHAFVASFPDPKLAGAMLRLCESARIDAALAHRYRGLAPEITAINRRLVMEMPPMAISTMLFKAAAGMKPGAEPIEEAFVNRSAGLLCSPARSRRRYQSERASDRRPLRMADRADRSGAAGKLGSIGRKHPADAQRPDPESRQWRRGRASRHGTGRRRRR